MREKSAPLWVVSGALCFCFLLLGASIIHGDSYPRQAHVDVQSYRFALELFDDTDEILGVTEVDVLWRSSGAAGLELDLVSVDESGAGMRVERVESFSAETSEELSFRHLENRLSIELLTPSRQGETAHFRVHYRGIPRDGLLISQNKHGDRTFFGDNWPERARHWLPTIDHPSDKARCRFAVTAPSEYQVVGCGLLREETDLEGDRRLTVFGSKVPMATKVMVIGVARFAVQRVDRVGAIELQSWVFPQQRDAGFFDFARAERVLRFYIDRLGPFPYGKLANVQSRTRYGGTENASNIFYNENSIRGDGSNEALIAHEIAHQWFGDSVTEADWHHLWLSEGFATYLTQLYLEHTYGHARFQEGMLRARQRVLSFYGQKPESAVIDHSVSDPQELLTANSYQKGAWVLHMLRRRLGDPIFWDGLRELYRRHRDGNAVTEDFRRILEELSSQKLDHFFEQWLKRPGHPVIEGSWSYDSGGQTLSLTLRQAQKGGVFEFPVEIAVVEGGEAPEGSAVAPANHPRSLGQIAVSVRETKVRLELDAMPRVVVLDPDAWLLAELKPLRHH